MNKISISILLAIILMPSPGWTDDMTALNIKPFSSYPVWEANHEIRTLDEYFWVHADTSCAQLGVIEDPTPRERGWVLRSHVFCQHFNKGINHRLYPTWNRRTCHWGPYISSFDVWVDLPNTPKVWVSLATYTNQKYWLDLFGINLETVGRKSRLVLFHTPRLGLSRFKQHSEKLFPKKQWVHVEVQVAPHGKIRIFQNGTLILSANKDWGPSGPGLCEAHWGLYAQGELSLGTVLNDNVRIFWPPLHRGD